MMLLQNTPVLYALEVATVKSVRVSADSVYIATDRPVDYKAMVMDSPARLVLELQNTKLRTLQDIPVGGATLRKVRTGQFKTDPVSVSRVVMELSQRTAYEITRKGEELIVMFGVRRAAVKDAPAEKPAAADGKVIQPSPSAQASVSPQPAAKPVVMTIEAEAVKPSDVSRETVPVVTSKRKVSESGRNIMDTLSRDPISFDYEDADIRDVFDMLAAKAGVNIIYSDDVSGTVTLSLSRVPFDEAFRTLLNVKGLVMQQVGDNIIRIASPKTILLEQKTSMLQTRVFFLNYAKAAEMKVQVDAVVLAEGRSSSKSTSDEVNNALIVTDNPVGLESTARLIRSLDRVPKQVLIEAKLIEVSLTDNYDLGVNWSYYSAPNSKGVFAGTLDKETNTLNPADAGGTGVALTAANIYGNFRFGKITSSSLLDIAISAAAQKGKAKVLSDPKVATLNNKAAVIKITDQTPYDQQTVTTSNGQSTTAHTYSNVETGITLEVTPTITSDGRISMHVAPEVKQLSSVPNGIAPPATATRKTDTNVIVNNGETIVIGGLIHDTKTDYVYKVPLLGDIPLLGVMFRKKSTARTRLELLIFVTPKIMED